MGANYFWLQSSLPCQESVTMDFYGTNPGRALFFLFIWGPSQLCCRPPGLKPVVFQ